jgi:chromosome segregation ATPase
MSETTATQVAQHVSNVLQNDTSMQNVVSYIIGGGAALVGVAFGIWRKFFKPRWDAQTTADVNLINQQGVTHVTATNAHKEVIDLWQEIAAKANADNEKQKTDFSKEKEALKSDAEKLKTEIEVLRVENTTLMAQAMEQLKKLTITEATAHNSQVRVDELKRELQAIQIRLENTADEVLEKIVIADTLRAENEVLQAFVTHLQTELSTMQEQLISIMMKKLPSHEN